MVDRITRGVGTAVVTAALVLSGAASLRAAMLAAPPVPAPALHTDNVLPGLSLLSPLGLPAPLTEMRIGIGVAPQDAAGEQSLYDALYDPKSPSYHQFLTPAQVAERFGVPAPRLAAVESWLRGGGLSITHIDGSGTYLQAEGAAASLDRLFDTTLRSYRARSTSFVANDSRPAIPAGLGIVSVVGLNTLQKFSVPARVHPNPGIGGLYTDAYTPQALWNLYDQPDDNMGQGQTMGVIGAGATDSVIGDLRRFEDINRLPHVPVMVKHAGAGQFKDTGAAVEWDLDTQSSTGMAPLARREDLYFGSTLSDADVEAAFSKWASDPDGPRQVDASFGECETTPVDPITSNPSLNPPGQAGLGLGNNLEPVADQTLLQATLEGRSLFASTGDTGSSCPIVALPVVGAGNGVANQVFPLGGYPAVSKYAVAVGGTVLYASAGTSPSRRTVEYAWTFTGGGSSGFLDEPDFQKGISAIDQPCLVSPQGKPYAPGTLCRGIPDVAAMSGDVVGNGYTIVSDMQITPGGGTSLSSPLWVGMWTRIQAAAPDQAHGNGFADPALYRAGKGPHYADDFHDITLGGNGLHVATPGWDYVSGFGTPNVSGLMHDIDGGTAPVLNLPPPAVPAPPLAGACAPVWTAPSGNANDPLTGDPIPQLDLIRGDLGLSPDGKDVQVTLTLTKVDGSLPADGNGEAFAMYWTYNGVTYFAHAHLDRFGALSFADGVSNEKGASEAHTDDTGTLIKGSPGKVVIDVPVDHVGSPPHGARLTYPLGQSSLDLGIVPVAVDTGGTQFDTLLQPCASGVPVTAAPPSSGPIKVGGVLPHTPLVPAPAPATPAAPAPGTTTPLLPPITLPSSAVGARLLGGVPPGILLIRP